MKHTNHYENRLLYIIIDILDSPLPILVFAVAGICMGIIFITSHSAYAPIERNEAISYSGVFENYKSFHNVKSPSSCTIYFEDGSRYSVYPHTESDEFRQTMQALNKGTKLYILVNPNTDYVIEIKTDTEELLNFELSQEAIDTYDNGYVVIGYFVCAICAFLIIYAICSADYKHKETIRYAQKRTKLGVNGSKSPALRHTDLPVKYKILAEASLEGYTICYRRVKSVNELVINGKVYDEKKGVIEFEHKLCANLDGHSVQAGTDENSYSYIMFDGEVIEYKKRWF